jgi:transglutaminase-like putative cysteine protease
VGQVPVGDTGRSPGVRGALPGRPVAAKWCGERDRDRLTAHPCRFPGSLSGAGGGGHPRTVWGRRDDHRGPDGVEIQWRELDAPHGGRVWLIDSPPGALQVDYHALLTEAAPTPACDPAELVYLRPSRYCQSDRLVGFASRHFHHLHEPHDILAAVSSWVGTQLEYIPGSSGPTDGAVDTLLAVRGVCRDYAHLAVALLRAMEIPARLVAVHAPGLEPMDFHAVTEAGIDGARYVVDATLLAPRRSLARIATGRDAADTSFLSSYGGPVTLEAMTVTATVPGDLPTEDVDDLSPLG